LGFVLIPEGFWSHAYEVVALLKETTNKQWHLKKENRAIQNGRPVGSIDKDKRKSREIIGNVLDDNTDRFIEEFERLKGEEFLNIYIKLLEFILPKLQRQAMEIEPEKIVRTFNFIPASKGELKMVVNKLSIYANT